jgi:large subunit ribosomal protein L24
MKQTFSSHWVSSVQPRKQRKYRFNAPLHVRGTFLHAHLSKELRTKNSTRTLRLRAGDEVRVLRGQHAGRSGKVERVDLHRTRVFVLGVENVKRDGTKKPYPLHPSNLLVTKLADDKRRFPVEAKPQDAKAPNSATKAQQKVKPQAKGAAAPRRKA